MTPIVLVPLDGSAPARSALPVAEGLARALGASLQVLHVAPAALPAAEAHRRLKARAEVVRTATGDPVAAILAAARPGAVVVLTRHCGNPAADTGLGHVADGVLVGADVPVLLVPPTRGDAPWVPGTALLPLDGTPGAAAAVRHAERLGAAITLLHVADPARPAGPGAFTAPRYADQPQHEWRAWRAEFADRAGCAPDAPRPRVRLVRGAPADAVLRAAADVDLLVVAWSGRRDGGHGDTLRALVAAAPCPVLVVRADDAPPPP